MKQNKAKKATKSTFSIIAGLVFFACGAIMIYFGISDFCHTKEYYNLKELSSISYDVKLLSNDFYESDDKLKDDQSYPSPLIDHIDTNFNYQIDIDSPSNINYTYSISAELIGKYKSSDSGTSEVWRKHFDILNTTTEQQKNIKYISIDKNFAIDYQKYSKIVADFKQQLKLSIDAELYITMNIEYSGKVISTGTPFKRDNIAIKMSLPITTNVTKITTDYAASNDQTITYQQPINVPLFVGGCVLICGSLLIIIDLIRRKFIKAKTEYAKDFDFILKSYNEVLVNVDILPKINRRQVITITTFDDLIDAEENLKTPILYKETKHGKETIFVIPTTDCYYRYILN